jgi:hypothetical protein
LINHPGSARTSFAWHHSWCEMLVIRVVAVDWRGTTWGPRMLAAAVVGAIDKPTDQEVGGSSPSERAKTAGTRASFGLLPDRWIAGHDVEISTRATYDSLIRNHIRPGLGAVSLTKLHRGAAEILESSTPSCRGVAGAATAGRTSCIGPRASTTARPAGAARIGAARCRRRASGRSTQPGPLSYAAGRSWRRRAGVTIWAPRTARRCGARARAPGCGRGVDRSPRPRAPHSPSVGMARPRGPAAGRRLLRGGSEFLLAAGGWRGGGADRRRG